MSEKRIPFKYFNRILTKNQATGNFKQNMPQRLHGFFPTFHKKFSTIMSKHMLATLCLL